ncbi:MAG: dTDP-4-dehydrorhamnose reductase [Lentisphaeria bacterium]|nr:dTDP-4-dehydrorhamnose reductase [Lentisphaeria bacterium]NQZ68963.1 dTDP-4-dehydrorhamnose reductase [Lentisphaeria bacterium]
MKIAILGAGMLGTDLINTCQQADDEIQVFKRPEFDICKQSELETAIENCEVLVNCSAYTQVDKAEEESEIAFEVNEHAVRNMAEICAQKNIYLIHISTDFVFNGEKTGPYTELDAAEAINVYGASKLAGENAILASDAEAAILRVQWSYGKAADNFVSKITELASSRDEISVVNDQFGCPTATTEIARAIRLLASKRATGIIHYAAEGSVSRYEFAKEIVEILNLGCTVLPCDSSKFLAPAKRPANSVFDCSLYDTYDSAKRKHWKTMLSDYLESI